MRPRGEDADTRRLREVLEHMRIQDVLDEDVELLNTRVLEDLPVEERVTFDEALYLCPTNALADDLNHARLEASNKPVLILPALHTGTGASKESDDNAEGLQPRLLLMESAKVMLTQHLWTLQGLTKGTMGVIGTLLNYLLLSDVCTDSIIFRPDQQPHTDLPSVIMVAIPSYRGPTEWHNSDGVPLVPIVPSVARWEKNGRPCSRKQYPLRLAYAISIHNFTSLNG